MVGEQISRRRFLGVTLSAAGVVVSARVSGAFGSEQKTDQRPAKSQNVAMVAYNLPLV